MKTNENINLVDILKDCPKGTKLYSIIFGEVDFEYIENEEIIVTNNISGDTEIFNQNGSWHYGYTNECMLFPTKDQRDWSKFNIEPELVDGEFYYCYSNRTENSFIFIYEKDMLYKTKCYVAWGTPSLVVFKNDIIMNNEDIAELRKATVEEKQQLLNVIKVRHYEWDADKKELVRIEKKFDISTLQPFDKVLVRDNNTQKWKCNFFDRIDGDLMDITTKKTIYLFICIAGKFYQCIPYNEETKHLRGLIKMPPEKYINWEE